MPHTVILRGEAQRDLACAMVLRAPPNAVVTIKPEARSNEQSSLMWVLLSDISRSKPEGRLLVPEVWKSLFLQALGHDQRFEQALDGRGVVPVGFRSSRLSKKDFSDLIMMIQEYGDRHNVAWSSPPTLPDRER